MSKRIKKIYKVLSIIAGLIIFLAIGLLIFINTSAGQSFLKNVIASQLENNLRVKVDIGSLETNLISYFNADKITVNVNQGHDAQPLLSVAKLRVKYSIYDLLFGPRDVEYLLIDSIAINLQRDSLGNFNLPSFPETTEEDSAFTLPINIVAGEIKHIDIIYNDNYIHLNFLCSNLQTIIRKGPGGNEHNLSTSIDSLKLDFFDEPITINNLFFKSLITENLNAKIDTFTSNISGLNFSGNFSKEVNRLTGNINIIGNPGKLLGVISGNSLAKVTSSSINAKLNLAALNFSSSPELSFKLNFPDYNINGIPVDNFNLNGKWFSDTLYLSDLSFKSLNGSVSSSGLVVFDSLFNHHFFMEAGNINLTPLITSITGDTNYITRSVSADFNLSSDGNLSNLNSLRIKSGFGLKYGNTKILNTHLDFNNQQLNIISDSGFIAVSSDIRLKDKEYFGKLNIDLTSLNRLFSLFNLKGFDGQFQSSSDLNGDWSGFNLNTNVNSNGVYYKNSEIVDTISIALNLKKDFLFIDKGFISGHIHDINSLASLAGLDSIGGDLKYSFSADGSMKEPHAHISGQIVNPSFGTFGLDSTYFRAELDKDTISISELKIKKDSILLIADGKINYLDKAGKVQLYVSNSGSENADNIYSAFNFNSLDVFSVSIKSNNFSLKNFNEFLPGLGIDNGDLSWELNVNNRNNYLQAALPFSVSNIKRDNLKIDSVSGTFKIHNDNLYADSLIVNIEGNKAYLNFLLGLHKDNKYFYTINENSKTEGALTGNGLELKLLNPLIERHADLKGSSNIDLHWNGVLKDPNITGGINLYNTGISLPDKTNLISDLNGEIAFKDSAVEINNINALYNKKPLSVKAKLNQHDTTTIAASFQVLSGNTSLINSQAFLNRDSINFSFNANNLDIALASPFVPSLQSVRGTFASKLSVIGKIDDPDINGTFRVNDISYNPNLLDLTINNGNIITHINSNQIVLDTAFFEIGKGILTASGKLLYDRNAVKNVNIDLLAENIQMSEKRTFSLRLNRAALKLGSTGQRYKLGGTVNLGTSRYEQNFELTDVWKALVAKTESVLKGPSDEPLDLTTYFESYPAKLTSISDYFKKLDLDIALQNSDSIWVDNNIAYFRIHPDVTLKGSVEIPMINGRVSVEENGRIRFLDRELNITQGLIEFNNPERLDPTINLSAESEVTSSSGSIEDDETYLVKLNILGPLDDLDFNLSSEPSLDGADIISLLSLGVTYQQLQASGNSDVLLKNRAEVLSTLALSNQLNNYFDKWLGDYIDIDRIGIGGNAFDLSQTRFEVSKRWSDNVELSYSTAVDNLDKQILKAKIKLIKYLYLEGKTDQENESGADLLFRIKFK